MLYNPNLPAAQRLPLDRSNRLGDLAARIADAHAQVGAATKSALTHALSAGDLLLEARSRIGRGQWLEWLQKPCGIPQTTASLYMRLAKNREFIEAQTSNGVASLTVRAALRLLKPKAPRKGTEHPKAKPKPAEASLSSLAWSDAPGPARTQFVSSVGLQELYTAALADQRQQFHAWLLQQQDDAPSPQPRPGIPQDLSIPDFLKREIVPTVATEEGDAEGDHPGPDEDEEDDLEPDRPKRTRKVRLTEHTAELSYALGDAFEGLAELAGECREVVENAPGGLRESERITTLENSADELEGVGGAAPEVSHALGKVLVNYNLPKHRYSSRQARASDAEIVLEACIQSLENIPDGDERHAEAQELIDHLQSVTNIIQSCEFPGQFG
jgi:hypothetical protein